MVNPFLKQSWTAAAVLINMVGQGMLLSYTTSLLPALTDPQAPLRTDLATASWVSSSVGVAGIPGFFLSSVLMDLYGRRIAHTLVIIPGAIGWTMIYFATNITTIMIGRVLGGMTAGATVALGAIVLGEYTDPKYRGMFLNLKTAAVSLGGMTVHILANFLHWRTIAMTAILPHIVAVLMTLTWVESPSWLAGNQQFEECEKSFYYMRGKTEASYRELEELIAARMIASPKNAKKLSFTEKIIEFFKRFTKKDFVKPVIINFFAALLLESCGRHIFPAYAMQIIGEITGSKANSLYFTLCIDAINISSAVFSSILVRLAKRRTLLFSTGFTAFFILIIVCTYLFLASRDIIPKEYNWIAISLFVLYFILVNLGCTPIPLALLGELYPLAHRGTGSIVSGVVMSLCVMMGLQLTPFLLISLKVYGTFGVFSVVMAISLGALYFMLPETKDKTLQEIEDYFNYGRFKERVDKDEEAKVKMVA